MAGSRIEPIAITVAGDEPEIAANSAQAITPASPRPPYQWPTIEVAKLIMRAGDAAMGQEIAGENEERDRHDLEAFDAGEQFQRHRLDRDLRSGRTEGRAPSGRARSRSACR